MGENQKILQYQWFDGQVRDGKYPNATTLGLQFEVVTKTAQRSIDFMRDQLNAPLLYNSSLKGYYYIDKSFVLPASEPTQEEMLAILLAQNILENSVQGLISRQIRSFSRKLFGRNGLFGVTEKKFKTVFSSSWNEYAPAQGHVFKKVMKALIGNTCITFTYTSPKDRLSRSRTVEPHHLQHYMGSWGLIAFCHVRSEWRWFMRFPRFRGQSVKRQVFLGRPRLESDTPAWNGSSCGYRTARCS